MTREIQDTREMWLEALRSGGYEQGIDRLYDGKSFCCLGVLCDVVADRVGGVWQTSSDANKVINFSIQGTEYGDHPPDEIMEMVGLRSRDVPTLIHLNDEVRDTFNQIAAYIEALPIREPGMEDSNYGEY